MLWAFQEQEAVIILVIVLLAVAGSHLPKLVRGFTARATNGDEADGYRH